MNKKIYIISFVSLIAILVLLMCIGGVSEDEFGSTITLPSAEYGRLISYDSGTKFIEISVHRNGRMYLLGNLITPSQLEEKLSEDTNSVVNLRVDGGCEFGNLQPVLTSLEKANIYRVNFRVYDE